LANNNKTFTSGEWAKIKSIAIIHPMMRMNYGNQIDIASDRGIFQTSKFF
jgi:hypothetical protein